MTRTKTLTLGGVLAVLAAVVAVLLTDNGDDDGGAVDTVTVDTVTIELRVWQRVDDPEELMATPRLLMSTPRLLSRYWDAIGTVPLPRAGRSAGYADAAVHHYSDLVIAGVGLRVWQRAAEPERISVQACASACPDPGGSQRHLPLWSPLGMNPLPLDDGHSEDGRYRYGDLTIAVPSGNPELLAERERLLAMRDVLEGGGADLDWGLDTPTASWEGVTVSGSPGARHGARPRGPRARRRDLGLPRGPLGVDRVAPGRERVDGDDPVGDERAVEPHRRVPRRQRPDRLHPATAGAPRTMTSLPSAWPNAPTRPTVARRICPRRNLSVRDARACLSPNTPIEA